MCMKRKKERGESEINKGEITLAVMKALMSKRKTGEEEQRNGGGGRRGKRGTEI